MRSAITWFIRSASRAVRRQLEVEEVGETGIQSIASGGIEILEARVTTAAPIAQHTRRAQTLEVIGQRIAGEVERGADLASAQIGDGEHAHDEPSGFIGDEPQVLRAIQDASS